MDLVKDPMRADLEQNQLPFGAFLLFCCRSPSALDFAAPWDRPKAVRHDRRVGVERSQTVPMSESLPSTLVIETGHGRERPAFLHNPANWEE